MAAKRAQDEVRERSRRRPSPRKAGSASNEAAAKPARRKPAQTAASDDPPDGEVRFTHPDRVYWADVGVTKQDLADYYRAAWDWMAPHVVNRPLSLLRCPDGTAGECFFQKHASAGLTRRTCAP